GILMFFPLGRCWACVLSAPPEPPVTVPGGQPAQQAVRSSREQVQAPGRESRRQMLFGTAAIPDWWPAVRSAAGGEKASEPGQSGDHVIRRRPPRIEQSGRLTLAQRGAQPGRARPDEVEWI